MAAKKPGAQATVTLKHLAANLSESHEMSKKQTEAVLGDLVAVARNRLAGTRGPDATTSAGLPVMPMGETLTRYHVSIDVADRPGVLARVADAFARHDVSIRAARQEARGDDAQLIIVSHQARDAALAATVSDLESLDAVRAVASVMRVEGEEGSP